MHQVVAFKVKILKNYFNFFKLSASKQGSLQEVAIYKKFQL